MVGVDPFAYLEVVTSGIFLSFKLQETLLYIDLITCVRQFFPHHGFVFFVLLVLRLEQQQESLSSETMRETQ